MSRSRSYNRFHRYLARQKRRGLRSVLPQYQMEFEYYGKPIDHSQHPLAAATLAHCGTLSTVGSLSDF